jgi:ubiquitin-conjugating enzyme E2 Q
MQAESQSSIVSISVRVRNLGLSNEAIQAWDLQPHEYITLLIRYLSGYKAHDNIISEPVRSLDIEFRVGVSNQHKPTVDQAMAAFAKGSDSHGTKEIENHQSQPHNKNLDFHGIFISSSLNEFMNGQFISLLKIRHRMGNGWDGAKRFYQDNQGKAGAALDIPSHKIHDVSGNYYFESSSNQEGLSAMATSDHIYEAKNNQLSFPLIAMQFFMRYLTRCTEFCLVCHDNTEEKFGALKPFVCSKPLCLYQVSTIKIMEMLSADV